MLAGKPTGATTKRRRPPDALLLDFGGTLDADGVHWAPRFLAAYREQGGPASDAAFQAAFDEGHRAFAALPGIRSLGFQGTALRLATEVTNRLPAPERVAAWDLAEAFRAPAVSAAARNGPVLERLARLRRLAAVSNFTGNLEPCLEELGLLRHFHAVVDSGRFGVAKPDERIFLEALRATGAERDSAWMVGDNPEADIRPALRLGLSACWIAPEARPLPPGVTPTARISRFADLERVLERACTV